MIWEIFLPIADRLKRFYPGVRASLMRYGSKLSTREFIAKNLFYSIVTFIIILLLFIKQIKIGLTLAIVISTIVYNYLMNIPKMKLIIKRREIESNLLFAINQISIKLSSGIPIIDAMRSVANSNFGAVSEEGARIVKKVEGGIPEVEAIEDSARKVSSPIARKIMWEIATSIRSGGDIEGTLTAIKSDLIKELEIKMKSYAGVLNTYLLMYMVISIVFPVLMILALIVISMLSKVSIPIVTIYAIPVLIIIFQFAIIGLVKTKRPYLWSD